MQKRPYDTHGFYIREILVSLTQCADLLKRENYVLFGWVSHWYGAWSTLNQTLFLEANYGS